MALIGNFTSYTHVEDETKKNINTITYSEDIEEGDPNYEFRGQTIETESPWVDVVETVYENCYIQIISFMFHKRMFTAVDVEDKKDECLDLHYRVYESEEARRTDFNNFIYEEHILGKQVEQNPGDDLRTLGYELIKSQPGFENMQNTND